MTELTDRLNKVGKLWINKSVEDSLDQDTIEAVLVKEMLYCGIVPANSLSYKTNYLVANKEEINITHKIIVRAQSIPTPDINMFVELDGFRYYVKAYDVNYKYKDSLELYCEVEMCG